MSRTGGTMTKHRRPLWRLALVVAMAAIMAAVTACGSGSLDPVGTAAPDGGGTSAHAGHGSASPAPTRPLRAGERFLDLAMPQPYQPSVPHGGTDEYRCLLIDPHLSKPAFLTGTQFQPQNVPIVHHAIVFAVPPEAAAAAHIADAETPGQGWTCFGDGSVDDDHPSAWVATWTPYGT